MNRKIKVGIDFDGVLAYNPLRIVRAPITYTKRKIFGKKKLKFYVPQTVLEKFIWAILHESSIFPARGVDLLRLMAKDTTYEFHIVTARYRYLQPHLLRWLDRQRLTSLFIDIHMNTDNRQPHIHKLDVLNRLRLDYFIEDNWDIVEYLDGKTRTETLWIFNILDKNVGYRNKFPYLEHALQFIRHHTQQNRQMK